MDSSSFDPRAYEDYLDNAENVGEVERQCCLTCAHWIVWPGQIKASKLAQCRNPKSMFQGTIRGPYTLCDWHEEPVVS